MRIIATALAADTSSFGFERQSESSWWADIIVNVSKLLRGGVDLPQFAQQTSRRKTLTIVSMPLQLQRREVLLEEIESYRDAEAGWDGYCEEPPNPQSLDAAKDFVRFLEPSSFLPEVAVSGGEDVLLCWHKEPQFLGVKFKKNRKLAYYCISLDGEEDTGERISFPRTKIPDGILEHIREITG